MNKNWFKPYKEDPEKALEILPPNMADDDWNYLVNLWGNKDWKVLLHMKIIILWNFIEN